MTAAKRPYLLRALYDWIIDSDEVPYVLVDATIAGVEVPAEHVKDGQIVLNIGPNAVRDLQLGNDFVICNGRFGGRPFDLVLPMASIKAIYCKGSGDGLAFPDEPSLSAAQPATSPPASVDEKNDGDDEGPDGDKPKLRLV